MVATWVKMASLDIMECVAKHCDNNTFSRMCVASKDFNRFYRNKSVYGSVVAEFNREIEEVEHELSEVNKGEIARWVDTRMVTLYGEKFYETLKEDDMLAKENEILKMMEFEDLVAMTDGDWVYGDTLAHVALMAAKGKRHWGP